MPIIDGIDGWIEIDGLRVPEYEVKIDGRTAECTIESREGAQFVVCTQDKREEASWGPMDVAILIDGRDSDSFAQTQYEPEAIDRSEGSWSVILLRLILTRDRLSATQVQPYTFAPVALTDRDDAVTATEAGFVRCASDSSA